MMRRIEYRSISIEKAMAFILMGVLLVGLILFGYLGIHNRYWADDWCYNADFKELGFFETLNGYNYITHYASNRYSYTIFSGLIYFMDILGVQLMTPINLIIWFFGLVWILKSVKKNFQLPLSNIYIFGVALVSIYFSLYTAPHLFQSVYWRSGVLPYWEPIIIGIIVFGLVFHQATLKNKSIPLIILSMVLAFITGGFSEAASATLVTAVLIYLGIAIINRKKPWAQKTLPIATAVLVASLLSMTVLIISPTNAQHLDKLGEQASLGEFFYKTFRFSYDFIKFSFMDAPTPHIAMVISSGLLGYALSELGLEIPNTKKIVLISLVVLIVAYLLVAASYAPSAYIERTPPAPRTRIIPRFILTFMLVGGSFALGLLLKQKLHSRTMPVLVSGLLVLMVLYTAYSVKNIYALEKIYSERAKLWDARSLEIEDAIMQGDDVVAVYGIDGKPVGGIRDFVSGGVGIWINNCAARYYGLEEIIVPNP